MSDKELETTKTTANERDTASGTGDTNPFTRRHALILGAICLMSLLGHIALLPQMPEMVPTHWDAAGNVNDYTNRYAMLGIDALPFVMVLLFRVLPGMDPRGGAYARMGSFYTGFATMITLFLVGMTWTSELTAFGILPETGSPIGMVTTIVAGVGLVLLGNYMPKVKRNYTFGCKIPWTLNDDRNWRLTHRFCGVAFVLAGIATIGASLISMEHGQLSCWILVGSLLIACTCTFIYSYLVFRNGNRPLRNR